MPRGSAQDTRLPVFTYGTLQTGFQNHRNVIRGRFETIEPAALPGAIVYHFAGCPGLYLDECKDKRAFGQLVTLSADVYDEVLAELDVLEEYYAPDDDRNLYDRRVMEVEVWDADPPAAADAAVKAFAEPIKPVARTVEAWVYVSLLDAEVVDGVLVPHGNWRLYLEETGQVDVGDDWSMTLASLATETTRLDMSTVTSSMGTAGGTSASSWTTATSVVAVSVPSTA